MYGKYLTISRPKLLQFLTVLNTLVVFVEILFAKTRSLVEICLFLIQKKRPIGRFFGG